jgi:hypothetical protein
MIDLCAKNSGITMIEISRNYHVRIRSTKPCGSVAFFLHGVTLPHKCKCAQNKVRNQAVFPCGNASCAPCVLNVRMCQCSKCIVLYLNTITFRYWNDIQVKDLRWGFFDFGSSYKNREYVMIARWNVRKHHDVWFIKQIPCLFLIVYGVVSAEVPRYNFAVACYWGTS